MSTEILTLRTRIAAGEDPDEVLSDIGRTRRQASSAFWHYGMGWRALLARGMRTRRLAAAKLYHATRARAEVKGEEAPHKAASKAVCEEFGIGAICVHKWLRAVGQPAQRPRSFTREETLRMVGRFQNGETYADIAKSVGRHRATVTTTIDRYRKEIGMPDTNDMGCL